MTAPGTHDENLKVCQSSIHEDRRECNSWKWWGLLLGIRSRGHNGNWYGLSVMARVGEWSIQNVRKMEWGHSTIVG